MRSALWLLLLASPGFSQTALLPESLRYSGPQADKLDIVFLGDGFTERELPKYRRRVDEYAKGLLAFDPYRRYLDAFNIWRVDVISKASGITNAGTGVNVDTALQVVFDGGRMFTANSEPERHMRELVEGFGLEPDVLVVIANDSHYGGGEGGGITYVSMHRRGTQILEHEVGHTFCTAPDDTHCLEDEYAEPGEEDSVLPDGAVAGLGPNLIGPGCKPQTWCAVLGCSVPPGQLKCIEGGRLFGKGVFHSLRHKCKMEVIKGHFCPVCARVISVILNSYSKTRSEYAPVQTS
jgi:hypothetical protein